MKNIFAIFLIIITLLALLVYLITYANDSYYDRMLSTKTGLRFSRQSIQLFYEQNKRFPDSLHELDDYAKKFPENIKIYFSPGEVISSNNVFRSEHQVLDSTGGLYYDPNKGEIKINLTKPLKSYWIFYYGEGRNEVPADW
ncbi:MAG: hypothetical protein JW787_08130 [Sedimentisphaerales bacterium]|nr:hypothetical protein [Sedimentisphaerales bacterium]